MSTGRGRVDAFSTSPSDVATPIHSAGLDVMLYPIGAGSSGSL